MTQLIEALSYPFVQRAIAAGVMISLCAALLGVIPLLDMDSEMSVLHPHPWP